MLSLSKRKDPVPPPADDGDSVTAARTRARRRLVGAAVLVGLGIIAFPLLFETQPRPIAVDIPIEIPPKDGVAPPPLPAAKRTAAPVRGTRPATGKTGEPVTEIVERADEAASAPPKAAASSAAPVAARSAASAPVVASPPVAAASAEPRSAASAPRPAQAVEARPEAAGSAAASEPKTPRYVVQAGAYTDAGTLRDARQKVERLGLKTYTQVIDSDAGPRTRVRVGPFATRDEAERAAARIKAAGVAANILAL